MTALRVALRLAANLAWCSLLLPLAPVAARPLTSRAIPQCTGVTLTAAYLAQVSASGGPGFLLVITNNTPQPIKLAKPFPSSAHWYGQTAPGRWLWRASSGSGGSLANALEERGPVLAYPASSAGPADYLIIGPRERLELTESMRDSPILRFRPGCQRCRNPGDERFRAVLAYAYLPAPGEQEVLGCGLRSSPIVMPPLE